MQKVLKFERKEPFYIFESNEARKKEDETMTTSYDIKEAIELAAGNYAELDLAEQWDYCWDADLAQAGGEWAEKALEILPSDCLYRQDLATMLLAQEAE